MLKTHIHREQAIMLFLYFDLDLDERIDELSLCMCVRMDESKEEKMTRPFHGNISMQMRMFNNLV